MPKEVKRSLSSSKVTSTVEGEDQEGGEGGGGGRVTGSSSPPSLPSASTPPSSSSGAAAAPGDSSAKSLRRKESELRRVSKKSTYKKSLTVGEQDKGDTAGSSSQSTAVAVAATTTPATAASSETSLSTKPERPAKSGKKRWGTLGRLSLRRTRSKENLAADDQNGGPDNDNNDNSDSDLLEKLASKGSSKSKSIAVRSSTIRGSSTRDLASVFKTSPSTKPHFKTKDKTKRGEKKGPEPLTTQDKAARLRYARSPLKRAEVMDAEKFTAGRDHVAAEIVTTENTYNFNLQTIVETYMPAVLPMVSQAEFKRLFSNAQVLFSFSSKLKAELEARLKSWSNDVSVADIFKKFTPFFRAYHEYYSNYDKAVETYVSLLDSNQEFAVFCLRELSNTPNGLGPDLQSLLVNPIQRMPRYVLLLSELERKATNNDEREQLKNVIASLQELTSQVNIGIKESDRKKIYDDLVTRVSGLKEHMAPARKLLYYGCFEMRHYLRPYATAGVEHVSAEGDAQGKSPLPKRPRSMTAGAESPSASGSPKNTLRKSPSSGTLRIKNRSAWQASWIALFSDMVFFIKSTGTGDELKLQDYASFERVWTTHGSARTEVEAPSEGLGGDSKGRTPSELIASKQALMKILLPHVVMEVRPREGAKDSADADSQSTVAEVMKFSQMFTDLLEQHLGEQKLLLDGDSQLRHFRHEFQNGDVYDGNWFVGQPHGKGTWTFSKGKRRAYSVQEYQGEFKRGAFAGQGEVSFSRGGSYVGDFKNGSAHGQGRLTTAEGVVYLGRWTNGDRNHNGRIEWPDSKDYFEGTFKRNYFQGTGTLKLVGSKYVGAWRKGRRHGEATERTLFGIYQGAFENDRENGKGTMWFRTTGERYEGDWKAGVRTGEGTLYFSVADDVIRKQVEFAGNDGSEAARKKPKPTSIVEGSFFQGGFRENMFDGQGLLLLNLVGGLLVRFEGDFERGQFSGQGKLAVRKRIEKEAKSSRKGKKVVKHDIWSYDGRFENGLMTGHGVSLDSSGNSYNLEFEDGVPAGIALFSPADGFVQLRVEYVDGRPVRASYRSVVDDNSVSVEESPLPESRKRSLSNAAKKDKKRTRSRGGPELQMVIQNELTMSGFDPTFTIDNVSGVHYPEERVDAISAVQGVGHAIHVPPPTIPLPNFGMF